MTNTTEKPKRARKVQAQPAAAGSGESISQTSEMMARRRERVVAAFEEILRSEESGNIFRPARSHFRPARSSFGMRGTTTDG